MLEIQIAGAGAGKTYNLAKNIINYQNDIKDHKIIYALTYTNAAAEKINYAILKDLGYIPNNIVIETIHSFLLNEIIYPFSLYILNHYYNNCSTIPLSSVVNFRAQTIKKLESKNVIHSEKVYQISKQIIDENNHKNNSSTKKANVKYIHSLLAAKIAKIFIDEVQDLDDDALQVFKIIAQKCSDVYMIGDPKQAIKYSDALNNFISDLNEENYVKFHPVNNVTMRVPSEILNISNRFCYSDQKQISNNKNKGTLKYLESNHPQFNEIISKYIKNHIVCIDKKQGKYSTSKNIERSFPDFVAEKIKAQPTNLNKDLLVKAAYIDFLENIYQGDIKSVIRNLTNKYHFQLETREYAEFAKLISQFQEIPRNIFNISSIDSIKGLDSDSCVIILSPNIYNYLIQKNLSEEKRFNKEWKKVYVALTRAKRELVIVLDHNLFKSKPLEEVRAELENLGFIPY